MPLRSTIMFTTAPARTGKTWLRCGRYLLEEFLPSGSGRHLSNFPIEFDPWTDEAGRKQPGLVALAAEKGIAEEDVRARVVRLDPAMVKAWKNEGLKANQRPTGPWDDFAGVDLSGCHIALDECHHFAATWSNRNIRIAWAEWLGEIGHLGCTIEFISQHPEKVADELKNEAEVKLQLTGSAHEYDPFMGLRWFYWDSLVARLGFGWRPKVWSRESRKVLEKWTVNEEKTYVIDVKYFGAFNSHAQPQNGGIAGSLGKHEWESYSAPKFWAWFLAHAAKPLSLRLGVVVVIYVLLFHSQRVADAARAVAGMAWKTKGVGDDVPKTPAEVAKLARFEGHLSAADSQRVADLLAQLNEQSQELAHAKQETAAAKAERDELREKLDAAFAIASLNRDEVTFRAGYTYRVGDLVDWGPYEGQKVASIDYPRRMVRLSGGDVLRMGPDAHRSGMRKVLDAADGNRTAAALVPNSIRSVAHGGENGGAKPTDRKPPGNPFVERPAPPGVRPLPKQPNGDQRDSRTIAR